MATKTARIIEILESSENITQREIAKKVGCTEGYVSKVKKGINTEIAPAESEAVDLVDPDDMEFESETKNFIRPVKIIPDPDTLTDNDEEEENETEEYECGVCGHVWTGGAKDYQRACPVCGEAFG